ncbi:MAG: ATP-binding cassette domain-containing protein [Gemmatimonadota bacterium]
MIELTEVRKTYGPIVALDGVSDRFAAGRTTVLIGPSGCGKSTLVRTLIGLVTPDAGRVVVDGTTVGPSTVRELRHRIGYVIQQGGLFPHLTARGNVSLAARHLGWGRDEIDERIEEACRLVRFPADRLGAWPGELSGGQRQRVSLLRALMLRPDLLLLDEPLGALDPMIRAELQDDLRVLFRTLERTVVMVTHDLAEAAHFADRIVLMRAGRIVQTGTIEDLTRRPADEFVERFVSAQRRLAGA